MKNKIYMFFTILGLSIFTHTVQAAEPLAFQGVMKELGKHMQTIAGAIANEDWDLVAKTAPLIAEHPTPSIVEKTRIFAFIGTDISKFKSFDKGTHESAHEMAHAAEEKNGEKVIAEFHKMQSSCLGCHQTFRKPFVEHFYGKK